MLLYSISIVKDRDDAEDIVQKAFISLWQRMDSVDFHTSARAYLYKSVYHASLDCLKRKKIRKQYEDQVKSGQRVIQAPTFEEKELSEKIQSAVKELPEQCGRIFKMSRYERLTYKQIAAALHISEKTVENHMSSALKVLRVTLKDYLPALLFLFKFYYGR